MSLNPGNMTPFRFETFRCQKHNSSNLDLDYIYIYIRALLKKVHLDEIGYRCIFERVRKQTERNNRRESVGGGRGLY